jgi:hypothetical protein
MFDPSGATPDVIVDGSSGRPLEIRASGARRAVTVLEAVRDETAAYPLGSGPRTVFIVRAQDRRYRLVHRLRDRRWTVEELDTTASGFARAA